jgi:hypothetical protein
MNMTMTDRTANSKPDASMLDGLQEMQSSKYPSLVKVQMQFEICIHTIYDCVFVIPKIFATSKMDHLALAHELISISLVRESYELVVDLQTSQ